MESLAYKKNEIALAYLTCLPEIQHDEDLKQIAMASDGVIHMIVDGVQVPPFLLEGNLCPYKDKICEIQVYRQSTLDRSSAIRFQIDAGYLAPQHILRHRWPNQAVYYEICKPFIYRIPLPPDGEWCFNPESREGNYSNVRHFDYIVVGDATKLDGLCAPYDEENTSMIVKIQRTNSAGNMLDFWFSNANTALFKKLQVNLQEFEDE